MRQHFDEIRSTGAVIMTIGPDNPAAFRDYWSKERLPFIGLSDSPHRVANAYGQQFRLLKLGRMPALVVVDREGHIRFRQYGESMSDIPTIGELLGVLDRLGKTTQLGRDSST